MKIKFNVGTENAVMTYTSDHATLQKAVDLLQRDEVISISITKQTPKQYLKNRPCLNEKIARKCANENKK